jgi:penicillin-binding protein 2
MDLHRAIVQSCDVYFYRAGLDIGVDRMAGYMKSFGFGEPTGIELENERGGINPSSEWKRKRFNQPWMAGETVSISIGQGYVSVTPLQLAAAYGALGTGRFMRPRLVLERLSPDGTSVPEPIEVVHDVPIEAEHRERVRKALRGVVVDGGGTGRRALVAGLDVGGKTGTAQVVKLEHTSGMRESAIPWKYRDHAWFGAIAPVDAPEIAVVVISEHGGHGGSAAAPIAQRVIAKWWEKRNAAPAPALEAAVFIDTDSEQLADGHEHADLEAADGAD